MQPSTARPIQLLFTAVLSSVLLGAFYFIGSVVVQSFLASSAGGGGGGASGARLKTLEGGAAGRRGRPVGGAALDASMKKKMRQQQEKQRLYLADESGKADDTAGRGSGGEDDGAYGAMNYHLNPTGFTEAISSCVSDSNCRILYHHVGKSGGTTIEDTFFTLFPSKLKSCCGPKLLGRLSDDKKKRTEYCVAKFSSYQIMGIYVEGLVKSCLYANNKILKADDKKKKEDGEEQTSRAVVLTSYREPIQRCLSSIHQMCNKNLAGRSNTTLAACRACRYDVETPVWDKVINMTLDHYAGVETVTRMRMDHVQILAIDMLDINSFFDLLREELRPSGLVVPETPWRNPEKKSVCSFSMPSEMMKALGPAQLVYRNLTSGMSK